MRVEIEQRRLACTWALANMIAFGAVKTSCHGFLMNIFFKRFDLHWHIGFQIFHTQFRIWICSTYLPRPKLRAGCIPFTLFEGISKCCMFSHIICSGAVVQHTHRETYFWSALVPSKWTLFPISPFDFPSLVGRYAKNSQKQFRRWGIYRPMPKAM